MALRLLSLFSLRLAVFGPATFPIDGHAIRKCIPSPKNNNLLEALIFLIVIDSIFVASIDLKQLVKL